MVAVIFEVIPNAKDKQEYLDIAASLKPFLNKIDGFISIERFVSLQDPNKILSLSYWSNETAVMQWRNLQNHRLAQKKGREYVFSNYTLHVAQVLRDYGMFNRDQAPRDSKKVHDD